MLTLRTHEIEDIFTQYPDLIRTAPNAVQPRVLELEAKYGQYSPDRFNSNVPYIHYERLLTRLRNLPSVERQTSEESQVASSGNIRRIIIANPGNLPETVIWQKKTKIRDIELTEYNVRISANIEEDLAPHEIPTNFTPNVIRDRTRHSFILEGGLVKVDLTEVMMADENKVIRPRYEVEVEYLGTRDDLPIFYEQIEYIFRLLRGTNLIYTTQTKNKMVTDIGSLFSGAGATFIDKNVLAEARNIKSRDLVYGGIVGNEHIDDDKILANPRRPEKPSGTNYMITFKADGLRKMLVIHTTGIWLVYPPYEFNLVLDTSLNVPQLDRLLNGMNKTVFDGELVVPRVPKNISYWYLAFDCIAFRGNVGIQRQPYTDRQKVVTAISGAIKTPVLTVDTKDTSEIKNPEDFFRLVTQFLDKRDTLEYDEDGLIFVPIDTYYNPMSQRYPLKDRTLTRIPDICKWKEGEDITIDFSIRWLPGGLLELHSYDEDTKQMVPFRGDTINPLTPDMIDHKNPLTLDKQTGTIVEYEWVWLPNPEGTRRTGIFRPRRLRPEKGSPNRLAIALDDWEDIMNPITEETLRGQTLDMVFSYHNRIKKALYETLTRNPNYNPRVKGSKKFNGVNILDIGSGRGGDVAKWLRLRDRDDPNTGFVVAVEPNSSNREELISRINTFGVQDRVTVVPTGGEDTVAITAAVRQNIPGGKVDAVTLMLSMSFFWASDSHLEALVNTIVHNLKPGGKIVFLTIDGDTVEQIFEPSLGGPHIKDLTLASAQLHLYPPAQPPFGRAIDFILPNTIVGQQREYLVHLQDFTSRLSKYGINLYEAHRAETEKLLSDTGSLYSSMYSYGYYSNDDNIAPNQEPTNVVLPIVPTPTKSPVMEMDTNVTTPVASPSPNEVPNPVQVLVAPQIIVPTIPVIPKVVTLSINKPTKFQIENSQLRMLDVSYTNRGKIVLGPATNDDTYAPLNCTWYKDLVRIATIGDGSCFIHAVLKAFYRDYQEHSSAAYRLNLAAKVRRDLAIVLGEDNPLYPGNTYWGTSARGAFPRMVMQQINDENLIGDLRVDYSLAGLQRLFNSTSQLGDEVYTFVADAMNVDIYVLRATQNDLYPHYHTRRPGVLRKGVVIIGNMYHYEVLAIDTANGLQTVFEQGDPFLAALMQLFIGDGDFNDIVNAVPYDPDDSFVSDFVEAFTTQDGLNIPPIIEEIFPEEDPFRVTLARLLPRIQMAARARVNMLGGVAEPLENPVMDRLDAILSVLQDAGFSQQDLYNIREVVEHRLKLNPDQQLESVVASLETDGTLSRDVVEAILNVNAAL